MRDSQGNMSRSSPLNKEPLKDPTMKVLNKEPETRVVFSSDDPGEPAISGMTDIGAARNKNEDNFLVAKLSRSVGVISSSIPEARANSLNEALQGYLMVVADGIGGHGGGELASAMAVDETVYYSLLLMPWIHAARDGQDQTLSEGMNKALDEGQRHMRSVARRKHVDERLGTTLTMAYVSWPSLHIVHVGDSRAYLYRDGQLHRMTRDHSLVQEMIDRADWTEDEAKNTRFANVLTRAIGGSEVEVRAEYWHATLRAGDRLMLCTDGLTNELDDEIVAGHLARVESAQQVQPAVKGLVQAAKEAGGRDNITVVLAAF
jgi:PPM family protein phosphatase